MPPVPPGHRPWTSGAVRTAMLALVTLLALGCGGDVAAPSAPTVEDEVVDDGLADFDPAGDALVAQLDALEATVVAARAELDGVAGAQDTEAVRAAGTRALALLLAGGADGATTGPTGDAGSAVTAATPLLPATTLERDATTTRPEDLLTATATVAGDDASPRARGVLELLRDPIAGDLGAWLRDPAGVVALVDEVADEVVAAGDDLERAELAVRALEGEATRALAWTFALLRTEDVALARAFAERAAAHLEVVRVGIALAREVPVEGTGDEADGATEPDPARGAVGT